MAEQYTCDLAEGIPTILQDGSTRYLTGPGGLPIEQVDGSGTVSYYIQDQLGSTRGLLDASGTVVGSSTYTPYGEVKGHSGASTPFGYAGQYTDSESGLQYLRARYYDPSSAQLLTLDPLLSATLEPYGYAGGNGLNLTDPSGMCGWVPAVPCPSDVAGAVVHGAGWVGDNADVVVPAALWGGAVAATAVCAYATLGICLAADAAVGGSLFAGGATAVSFLMPPGEGPLPDDGGGLSCHSQYGDGTVVYEGQQPPRIAGPDQNASGAHSVLRWDPHNKRLYQAREYNGQEYPVRDIDFTNPTFPGGRVRPGHPGPPHQHLWRINQPEVGPNSGFVRGQSQPL